MSFDPNEFLNQTVTGALDTSVINPEDNMSGEPYQAHISKVEARTWVSKADPSKSGIALDVIWEIDDESVKTFCNRDKVSVRQGIMLDLTDSGSLDIGKGKNIALGRLREALGLNRPGEPFSFSMLEGQYAGIHIAHRIDGENVYVDVKRVVPFG